MRILAIDPGTTETGWCILDTDDKTIVEKGIDKNEEFRTGILQELYEIKSEDNWLNYDEVVIEMVASYGMPVGKEVFETVLFTGRLYGMFELYDIKPTLMYRKEAMYNLTGNYNGKDKNIRQAILDLYPAIGGGSVPQVGTKKQQGLLYGVKSHIWSALGLALSHGINKGLIKPY